MHSLMILVGVLLAWGVRLLGPVPPGSLNQRWYATLGLFLFSPLLLLMTAISVLWMGPSGRMLGHWEGAFSYDLAVGFLVWAIASGVKLAWAGHQTVARLQQHPAIIVQGEAAQLLDTPIPYSAQVGFWRPLLLVSQGLLNTLDDHHLTAVIAHERAHARSHDTFWFFWLGWLRRLTGWLPGTTALWQELLLLRELRADQAAAQQVDPLTLAEALLLVVSAPFNQSELCASFGSDLARDRLTERIDALLAPASMPATSRRWTLGWLGLVLLPLAAIPFHGG